MTEFNRELTNRLAAIREQGLYRELRRVDSPQGPHIEVAGRTLVNFSSNDYLGLANHPALKEAAIKAVERFGAGSGASRLICGSLAPHHELEEELAAFKEVEAALTFSSGYAAAVGTICALLGKDDIIILDKLVHACIVDAARLSGAKLRVFAHNDLNDLEDKLKWANSHTKSTQHATRNTLIVTESIFSMDGDAAPLKEIVALKGDYGAWLMVDEAHATGLYGAHRRGLAEAFGVSDRIEIQMGTLGKALGASGGYICGSRALIDLLVNRARTFIFSTAPVPAAAAAALAAIRLIQSSEGEMLRAALWQNVNTLVSGLRRLSNPSPPGQKHQNFVTPSVARQEYGAAILPLIVGDEAMTVQFANRLRERGIFIPAIRYPTVARGSARLRMTLTAALATTEVSKLLTILETLDIQFSLLRSGVWSLDE